MKTTHKGWAVGDKVMVKQAVESYYSNYGGKPRLTLTPELVGTIGAVRVPYVRRSSTDSYARRGDYFVCVDYIDPASGQVERAGVAYGNLKRAR